VQALPLRQGAERLPLKILLASVAARAPPRMRKARGGDDREASLDPGQQKNTIAKNLVKRINC
jgi:hypothetical protein